MDRVDCVVIGAGVIGLAVARQLARAGAEVIVVERASSIGTETSSRNSEVIHAGIYYPAASVKARTCVQGKELLYAYCIEKSIPHQRCGKLIVATSDDQRAILTRIKDRAAANGVYDLTWLEGERVKDIEPAVACKAALLSPSTGIIDSHRLMLAYRGDAEDRGAMFAFNAPVEGGKVVEDGIVLDIGGKEPITLLAKMVVNAAGLFACEIASRIEGFDPKYVPEAYFVKGNYYILSGNIRPFRHLVYPVPEDGGLGIHVTLDLAGGVRFGPDVEWIDAIDYTVDPRRSDGFYEAIRRYYPDLKDGAIEPGYAGIRPKISPKGTDAADFVVQGPEVHGIRGLVNLFGIESPGLTASLVLAHDVELALGDTLRHSPLT